MPSPSLLTTTVFVALVLCVATLAILAILSTPERSDSRNLPRRSQRSTTALTAAAFLFFYLAAPAVLARAGALDRYAPLPAPALLLVLGLAILTIVAAMSPFGSRLAARVGLVGLIGFQAFRVPVEWLLHRLFTEGIIPVQMTYAGRNFDVVSGVTAALLGLWLASGRAVSRTVLLAWNLLGLGLLANIVIIALLSTPVPFRQFMNEPPNLLPSTFPYVWLPTFLVPAALFGHLLLFRVLRRSSR